jgi:hypothetical protein
LSGDFLGETTATTPDNQPGGRFETVERRARFETGSHARESRSVRTRD